MIVKLQYNKNFYYQYSNNIYYNQDIQLDISNLDSLLFCGEGGNSNMKYKNKNIPIIYNNELSSESQIKYGDQFDNIFKDFNYFSINNLLSSITDSNYILSPFRLTIIPIGGEFILAPRVIFGESVYAKILNYGEDYIDISSITENNNFIFTIESGDKLKIGERIYTCIDLTTLPFGKRIFLYPEIIETTFKYVYNCSKFKNNNIKYNKIINNKVLSNIKIMFLLDYSNENIEMDLQKYDDYTVLYIDNNISHKLYNVIFNRPIQIIEDWDNFINKIPKHILLKEISKTDNYIYISDARNVKIGDYLVAKWYDGTENREIMFKVVINDGNAVFVEQNREYDVPLNAEIYRSYSYNFILFVYNTINSIDSFFENIILKLEYI